jgi:hypothetical protein
MIYVDKSVQSLRLSFIEVVFYKTLQSDEKIVLSACREIRHSIVHGVNRVMSILLKS